MINKGANVLITADSVHGEEPLSGVISKIDSNVIYVEVKEKLSPLPPLLAKPHEFHRLLVKNNGHVFEIQAFYKEVQDKRTIVFQAGGAVSTREGRRFSRYNVRLDLEYQIVPAKNGSKPRIFSSPNCEIILSEAGIGFYADCSIQKGDSLNIWLNIPGDEDPLPISGKAVYARSLKFGCRIGVQFNELEDEARQRLANYIKAVASAHEPTDRFSEKHYDL